jgi:hypothetical protein
VPFVDVTDACYGIVTEQVGATKIGATPLVLTAGSSNDDSLLGIAGGMRINDN